MTAQKAIILAAGRGSRLGQLTHSRPKCLTELDGRPLIEWQLAALRRAGIEDIIIVGGYENEQLRQFGQRIIVNPDWAETNMVHTLFCAEQEADQPVVISYSDIVYDPECAGLLANTMHDTAVCYDLEWHDLWSLRFEDPLSDAESFRVDANGRVQDIGRSNCTLPEIEGQYMGLLRFSPATFHAIRNVTDEAERRTLDMTSLLRRLVDAGHPVFGLPIRGRWCEIDDQEDLQVARKLLDEEKLSPPF